MFKSKQNIIAENFQAPDYKVPFIQLFNGNRDEFIVMLKEPMQLNEKAPG